MDSRSERRHEDGLARDQRTSFQRDRDRILYTSAFRRLAGVTQVVAPTERHLVHNRLTHTLEVAQVARRLAEKLRTDVGGDDPPIDPDVAEAAALAHDLGHPPFGHIAESELDRLAVTAGDADGFNGNAQSFRILTKLAVRTEAIEGLNLTRATLNAVLKYPWFRQTSGIGSTKWGAYRTEQDVVRWVRPHGPWDETAAPSLEATIMDWADDIAYAIHDVEDFYRAGLMPLDRLVTDKAERNRFAEARLMNLGHVSGGLNPQAIFVELAEGFPITESYVGTRRQRALIRGWTSTLISRYLHATTCSVGADASLQIAIGARERCEVLILKQLTWHYVIDRASLAMQQYGQRAMIRTLFSAFTADTSSVSPTGGHHHALFPAYYRDLLEQGIDDTKRTRLVIDLIASMTERQVVDTYRRLSGIEQGSAFELL